VFTRVQWTCRTLSAVRLENPPVKTLIDRFSRSERAAHWLLAASFASMLASGVFMGGIGPLGHHRLLLVHVGSAIVLIAGLVTLISIRRSRRPLAQTLRDMQPIDASDRRWLVRAPRAYLTGGELPAAGRFNAGQKVNARLVLLVLVVLFVSGVGELGRYVTWLGPARVLGGPHGLAAGVASALVAMHIYLAILHPATRPAFRGIVLGSVDRAWAEEHHGRWVAQVDAGAATPPAPSRRARSRSRRPR
jgi:formate dehydrogenase subunit gamma